MQKFYSLDWLVENASSDRKGNRNYRWYRRPLNSYNHIQEFGNMRILENRSHYSQDRPILQHSLWEDYHNTIQLASFLESIVKPQYPFSSWVVLQVLRQRLHFIPLGFLGGWGDRWNSSLAFWWILSIRG